MQAHRCHPPGCEQRAENRSVAAAAVVVDEGREDKTGLAGSR